MVLGHSVSLFRVKDVDRIKEFYETALGLEVRRFESGRIVTFHIPGGPEVEFATGGEIVPPVSDRIHAPCIVIFHVEDVEEALRRCVEAGGSVVNKPFSVRTSTLAYIADPEGHVVGFSSRNQTTNP